MSLFGNNFDSIDIIVLIVIFLIFIFLIIFVVKNELCPPEHFSLKSSIIDYSKKFHILENNLLTPNVIYFSCKIGNVQYYLGYVPSEQCISEIIGKNTTDCSKYNMVLETMDDVKNNKNIGFNIFNVNDYNYTIGTESIFNKNDFININYSLFSKTKLTNVCCDTDVEHNFIKMNVIKKSIETSSQPATYNLCFVIDNVIYYITYAEKEVEPCFFYYTNNNVKKKTALLKAAITQNPTFAINFVISPIKPF